MDAVSDKIQKTDEELALNAQAGSRHSYEELVSRYCRRLFYYLRPKISKDQETEDIVQETFLKLYKNIQLYNSKWKFSTWLFTAANRLAISHYRAQKKLGPDILFPIHDQGPEEKFLKKEKQKNIWEAARDLHPDQYNVLWLRYQEEMPVSDIALVMRKKSVSIRVLLHRARIHLAEILEPSLNCKKGLETPIRKTKENKDLRRKNNVMFPL